MGAKSFEMNDLQRGLFEKLTPLRQKVALNHITGMKPAEAHRNAGGTCKNESNRRKLGNEILSKQDVRDFISAMADHIVNPAIMSRDEALEILSNNARVKISDIATFSYVAIGKDSEGNDILESVWTMKVSDEIDPNVMSCIKSVTMTKNGPKIELHDQQGAIKQISTMQGWESASKLDLSSSDGSMSPAQLTPEQSEQARKEMLADDDC